MMITIDGTRTRNGAEKITFRYGKLKSKPGYGCAFMYENLCSSTKKISCKSDVFIERTEYDAMLFAVKQAESFIREASGDHGLPDKAWQTYLDSKQYKLFKQVGA